MDKKEELKRKNYFDFKRDEFMALNEYLQSPISEIDLQKMNEGGMMTMENMTIPIGYQEGGPVPRSRQQSVMEEEAMQSKAKPEGGMLSGLISLIKDRLAPQQREDGGEEYMKIFDFLWQKGFDSQQIDDIINRKVNQEDIVPSRKNLEEKFKG